MDPCGHREHIHKKIRGLIGKIEIDFHDEDDVIIVELSSQLDNYNPQN